jgi:hypothetical protein
VKQTVLDGGSRPLTARPSVDMTRLDPAVCPLSQLAGKNVPAIQSAKTPEALQRVLVSVKQPERVGEVDLVARAKESKAFGVDVHAGYFKDSTSTFRHHHAVFVLPKSVVYTGNLVSTNEAIPPACGGEVQSKIIFARIVDGTDGRRYGHVRVRRRDVDDKPTLPTIQAAPSDRGPECEELVAFRIEDHLIDLAARTHVLGLAQTYQAPLYAEVDLPATGVNLLTITKQEVTVDDPRCGSFSLRR